MRQVLVSIALLVLITYLDVGSSGLTDPPVVDIIGGNSTNITQHPYQVAIWSDNEFRGSGAIVGKGWAITLASIVYGYDQATLRVRTHSSSASSGGGLYNVTRVLVHPRFHFTNMTFDVALLRLRRPVTSMSRDLVTSRCWIALARGPAPTNASLTVSGWGASSEWSKMSDELLQTTMTPVNTSQCQNFYTRPVSYSQFCATPVNVYGPCWGDYGDPLVYNGKLYGLLSWNKGCYDQVVPSVFTDMSTVYRWVLRTMKRKNHRHGEVTGSS